MSVRNGVHTEPKEILGLNRITKKRLRELCRKDKLYQTPSLNDVLYLHYQGFQCIECLEDYTELKCLWLECNALSEIQGLENQHRLKCLFLQSNIIKKIENLEFCKELDTINLSQNHIRKLENINSDILPVLNTLNISSNYIKDSEDLKELENCKNLSVVDLSNNRIDDILVVKIFSKMPELKVLILQGNPVVSKIPQYRKTLILECKKLTYLDSRPVFPKDRACAEAWKRGGYQEERKENERWNRKERRKIRDSVNATIRMRNRNRKPEDHLTLLVSSDSDDEAAAAKRRRQHQGLDADVSMEMGMWDDVAESASSSELNVSSSTSVISTTDSNNDVSNGGSSKDDGDRERSLKLIKDEKKKSNICQENLESLTFESVEHMSMGEIMKVVEQEKRKDSKEIEICTDANESKKIENLHMGSGDGEEMSGMTVKVLTTILEEDMVNNQPNELEEILQNVGDDKELDKENENCSDDDEESKKSFDHTIEAIHHVTMNNLSGSRNSGEERRVYLQIETTDENYEAVNEMEKAMDTMITQEDRERESVRALNALSAEQMFNSTEGQAECDDCDQEFSQVNEEVKKSFEELSSNMDIAMSQFQKEQEERRLVFDALFTQKTAETQDSSSSAAESDEATMPKDANDNSIDRLVNQWDLLTKLKKGEQRRELKSSKFVSFQDSSKEFMKQSTISTIVESPIEDYAHVLDEASDFDSEATEDSLSVEEKEGSGRGRRKEDNENTRKMKEFKDFDSDATEDLISFEEKEGSSRGKKEENEKTQKPESDSSKIKEFNTSSTEAKVLVSLQQREELAIFRENIKPLCTNDKDKESDSLISHKDTEIVLKDVIEEETNSSKKNDEDNIDGEKKEAILKKDSEIDRDKKDPIVKKDSGINELFDEDYRDPKVSFLDEGQRNPKVSFLDEGQRNPKVSFLDKDQRDPKEDATTDVGESSSAETLQNESHLDNPLPQSSSLDNQEPEVEQKLMTKPLPIQVSAIVDREISTSTNSQHEDPSYVTPSKIASLTGLSNKALEAFEIETKRLKELLQKLEDENEEFYKILEDKKNSEENNAKAEAANQGNKVQAENDDEAKALNQGNKVQAENDEAKALNQGNKVHAENDDEGKAINQGNMVQSENDDKANPIGTPDSIKEPLPENLADLLHIENVEGDMRSLADLCQQTLKEEFYKVLENKDNSQEDNTKENDNEAGAIKQGNNLQLPVSTENDKDNLIENLDSVKKPPESLPEASSHEKEVQEDKRPIADLCLQTLREELDEYLESKEPLNETPGRAKKPLENLAESSSHAKKVEEDDHADLCMQTLTDLMQSLELKDTKPLSFEFPENLDSEEENNENNKANNIKAPQEVPSLSKTIRDVIDSFDILFQSRPGTDKSSVFKELTNAHNLKQFNKDTHASLDAQLEEIKNENSNVVRGIVDRVYAKKDRYDDTIELIDDKLMVVNKDTGELSELPALPYVADSDADYDTAESDGEQHNAGGPSCSKSLNGKAKNKFATIGVGAEDDDELPCCSSSKNVTDKFYSLSSSRADSGEEDNAASCSKSRFYAIPKSQDVSGKEPESHVNVWPRKWGPFSLNDYKPPVMISGRTEARMHQALQGFRPYEESDGGDGGDGGEENFYSLENQKEEENAYDRIDQKLVDTMNFDHLQNLSDQEESLIVQCARSYKELKEVLTTERRGEERHLTAEENKLMASMMESGYARGPKTQTQDLSDLTAMEDSQLRHLMERKRKKDDEEKRKDAEIKNFKPQSEHITLLEYKPSAFSEEDASGFVPLPVEHNDDDDSGLILESECTEIYGNDVFSFVYNDDQQSLDNKNVDDAACFSAAVLNNKNVNDAACFSAALLNNKNVDDAACFSHALLNNKNVDDAACFSAALVNNKNVDDAACFSAAVLNNKNVDGAACFSAAVLNNKNVDDVACFSAALLNNKNVDGAACFSAALVNHKNVNDAASFSAALLNNKNVDDAACFSAALLNNKNVDDAASFSAALLNNKNVVDDAACFSAAVLNNKNVDDAACFSPALLHNKELKDTLNQKEQLAEHQAEHQEEREDGKGEEKNEVEYNIDIGCAAKEAELMELDKMMKSQNYNDTQDLENFQRNFQILQGSLDKLESISRYNESGRVDGGGLPQEEYAAISEKLVNLSELYVDIENSLTNLTDANTSKCDLKKNQLYGNNSQQDEKSSKCDLKKNQLYGNNSQQDEKISLESIFSQAKEKLEIVKGVTADYPQESHAGKMASDEEEIYLYGTIQDTCDLNSEELKNSGALNSEAAKKPPSWQETQSLERNIEADYEELYLYGEIQKSDGANSEELKKSSRAEDETKQIEQENKIIESYLTFTNSDSGVNISKQKISTAAEDEAKQIEQENKILESYLTIANSDSGVNISKQKISIGAEANSDSGAEEDQSKKLENIEEILDYYRPDDSTDSSFIIFEQKIPTAAEEDQTKKMEKNMAILDSTTSVESTGGSDDSISEQKISTAAEEDQTKKIENFKKILDSYRPVKSTGCSSGYIVSEQKISTLTENQTTTVGDSGNIISERKNSKLTVKKTTTIDCLPSDTLEMPDRQINADEKPNDKKMENAKEILDFYRPIGSIDSGDISTEDQTMTLENYKEILDSSGPVGKKESGDIISEQKISKLAVEQTTPNDCLQSDSLKLPDRQINADEKPNDTATTT